MAILRLIECINAAKSIVSARRKWLEQDGPNVVWQGHLCKTISAELDAAIRNGCDLVADDGKEIEEKAKALLLIFDDLSASFLKWLQDASVQLPSAPPMGSDVLVRTLDRLEQQLQVKDLPLPPPVAELDKRRVTANQIANIYGWKLEDGSPDTQKVYDELAKPGTHFDPKTWVHPAVASQQAEVDRLWQNRSPRTKCFSLTAEQSTKQPGQIPSVEELIDLRAPIAQIVRLHGLTEEQVRAEAAKRNIDLEARYIQPANPDVAHHERMDDLDQIEESVMQSPAKKQKTVAAK